MPKFILNTKIYATSDVCFNLARSIDLHLDTMKHTGEKAIAGVTNGLIGLNETVTWKARHFGVVMKLTSRITACEISVLFADEMVAGPFKMMRHKHVFEQKEYMQNLIENRNQMIKQKAEHAMKDNKTLSHQTWSPCCL